MGQAAETRSQKLPLGMKLRRFFSPIHLADLSTISQDAILTCTSLDLLRWAAEPVFLLCAGKILQFTKGIKLEMMLLEKIDGYKILVSLGRGTMGQVYPSS